VSQARIQDCTLHASLAALTLTPQGRAYIRSMLQMVDATPRHEIYRVRIWEKTLAAFVPKTVYVKAEDLEARGIAHQVDGDGKEEVWPRVIEEALLSVRSGKTPTDNMPDTYGMLTGRPAADLTTAAPWFEQKLWDDNRAHKVQVLSTSGAFPADLTSPTKLIANHAYTVVGLTRRDGTTWVQLRNPWGHSHPAALPLDQIKRYFPTYSHAAVP
jgi:hypothetical protein